MPKKIAVVGAGVGGLSSAVRLAKNGYQVDVHERLPHCGGRNNFIADRGFFFDTGPSFVLMPDFFDELFFSCGANLRDYLKMQVLDPSYKIFYSDGDVITIYRDSERTKEELERVEPNAAKAFEGFIKETSRIYDSVKPLLYTCFTPRAIFQPSYWPLLKRLKPFMSYWDLARRFFKSEKLCYAFTFEAMFIGVSPFQSPSFYSIISYTDHVQKIFHPMGGMYQIPRALERLGKELGVTFHYNRDIQHISRKDSGFVLDDGEGSSFADTVVVNADYASAQTDLLKRTIPRYHYSCSVYLMYLGLKKKVDGAAHHNLFFSSNLRKNLRDIFSAKRIPEDPSFYVHVPTVTDVSLAPAGKDIFYILVPVANLKRPKEIVKENQERIRRAVFNRINKVLGIDVEDLIEVEHRFLPEDFISRYRIKYGATFGLSHTLSQSAFFRPANIDTRLPGVYYCGASTQPGGGLPVVIAGSRIVADSIKQRLPV